MRNSASSARQTLNTKSVRKVSHTRNHRTVTYVAAKTAGEVSEKYVAADGTGTETEAGRGGAKRNGPLIILRLQKTWGLASLSLPPF